MTYQMNFEVTQPGIEPNRQHWGQPERSMSRVQLPTGIMMHYVARMPESLTSAGGIEKALVLVHGYSDSWRSFSEMLDLFSPDEMGMPIFAVDLRGHGGSTEDVSGSYEQKDFAEDLAAFMETLRIQAAVVVGHSMGGLVAHQFALDYPEKVSGLVLISTIRTLAGWEGLDEMKAAIYSLPDDEAAPFDFIQAFQASTFFVPPLPDVLHRYVSESLRLSGRVWKATLAGMEREDHSARLSEIDAPALILWGEQDALFSREQQDVFVELLADVALLTYPEAGHALNVERAADLVREIESFVNEIA